MSRDRDSSLDRSSPSAAVTAATPVASGLHGVVLPFDRNQEEWVEYAERLESYFIANDITDTPKRRAILLNGVGPSTYCLIKTLALPGSTNDFKFEELVDMVITHYNPKPSPIFKRFKFNHRCQKEGETVSQFIADCRRIAEHCEYGAVLNDMLRDRLVYGIADK